MKTLRIGVWENARKRFGLELKSAEQTVCDEVVAYVDQILVLKKTLSNAQKNQVKQSILDELFGYGPIGPAFRHPRVGNIYLEGTDAAYIEYCGTRGRREIQKMKLPFDSDEHLLDVKVFHLERSRALR